MWNTINKAINHCTLFPEWRRKTASIEAYTDRQTGTHTHTHTHTLTDTYRQNTWMRDLHYNVGSNGNKTPKTNEVRWWGQRSTRMEWWPVFRVRGHLETNWVRRMAIVWYKLAMMGALGRCGSGGSVIYAQNIFLVPTTSETYWSVTEKNRRQQQKQNYNQKRSVMGEVLCYRREKL